MLSECLGNLGVVDRVEALILHRVHGFRKNFLRCLDPLDPCTLWGFLDSAVSLDTLGSVDPLDIGLGWAGLGEERGRAEMHTTGFL